MPDNSTTGGHRPEVPSTPRPFDKLYWLRFGCGIVSGVAADYIWKLPQIGWYNAITVALLAYLLTYYGARYTWYRKLEASKQGKIFTTGVGSFVMLFIFTWVLLATLFQ
jgi:hypothetical protein